MQLQTELAVKAASAQRFLRWDAATAAAAAALEAHQREAGFVPLLTAAQLQLLGMLLAIHHYSACIRLQQRAQQPGRQGGASTTASASCSCSLATRPPFTASRCSCSVPAQHQLRW